MPTKRKQPTSPDAEALRADLDAPIGDSVEQLLERASQRAGRQLFTVPQARAAVAELATREQPAASRAITRLDELDPMSQIDVRDNLVKLLVRLAALYELVRRDIDELDEALERTAVDLVVHSPPPTDEDLAQFKTMLDEEVIQEGTNFLQQLRYHLVVRNAPPEVFRWACADLPPNHPAWALRETGLPAEGNAENTATSAAGDGHHVG